MQMNMLEILNLIAIIIIPVTSVLVGQWLQIRVAKRNEKLEIFKTLMMTRGGWTMESIRALNIIDVVFAHDKKVRAAWQNLSDTYRVENPDVAHLKKMELAKYKLLETMSHCLGYKKITWETIQYPYYPQYMADMEEKNNKIIQGQVALAEFIKNAPEIIKQSMASSENIRNKDTI